MNPSYTVPISQGGKELRCLGSWNGIVATSSIEASAFVEAPRNEITLCTTTIVARFDLEGAECIPVIVTFNPFLDFRADESSSNGLNSGFELIEFGLLQYHSDAKECRHECGHVAEASQPT